LEHTEYNNIRNVWLGHWTNPYYVMYFYNECNTSFLGIGMGKESVAIFTQPSELNIPTCTKDDFTRIEYNRITVENPYNGSGVCTFEFRNAVIASSEQEYGGVEGIYDTKLTVKTTMQVPYKCFVKTSENSCEWNYGGTNGKPLCDIPTELDKENFWGLAKYFGELNKT